MTGVLIRGSLKTLTLAHRDDCEGTERRWPLNKSRREASEKNQPCPHLDLRLLASRTEKINFFFKPFNPWYFVTAALANNTKPWY